MGKDQKAKKGGGAPANLPSLCHVTDCGKKSKRAGFCTEHFSWFKVGLVNRKGERPKDFDKKYQAYKRKQAERAA